MIHEDHDMFSLLYIQKCNSNNKKLQYHQQLHGRILVIVAITNPKNGMFKLISLKFWFKSMYYNAMYLLDNGKQ